MREVPLVDYDTCFERGQEFRKMVVDDEADEGSALPSVGEDTVVPFVEVLLRRDHRCMQLPSWRRRRDEGELVCTKEATQKQEQRHEERRNEATLNRRDGSPG